MRNPRNVPLLWSRFEKIREDVVERPRDLRLEDLRLAKTLSQLKISTFLTIFSSLLLERKVILLSSQIR